MTSAYHRNACSISFRCTFCYTSSTNSMLVEPENKTTTIYENLFSVQVCFRFRYRIVWTHKLQNNINDNRWLILQQRFLCNDFARNQGHNVWLFDLWLTQEGLEILLWLLTTLLITYLFFLCSSFLFVFRFYFVCLLIDFENCIIVSFFLFRKSLSAAAATGDLNSIHDMMARGGHIDERDTQLNTPLHHACLAGHLEAVELLLSYGADVTAENSLGKCCLQFAGHR